MTPYCSLAEAKAELKAVGTADDTLLLARIRQVSARLDGLFQSRRPLFLPYSEARQVRVEAYNVNTWDGTLDLNMALLALSAVSVGSETLVVGTDVEAWPTLNSPYRQLRLMRYGNRWDNYCSSTQAPLFASITGIWGIHRDYSQAWLSVDTLAAAVTNTAVTSLTVADVDGADAYGWTPRISAGHILKIDDEYLEVTATNTGTNAVTVMRGVLGTTAATHLISAPVYVWQTEEPVRRIVGRQTASMYARRGAFETATLTDVGVVTFPADLLSEVRATLGGYAYE